ncbi:MAG: DUF2268 domain-containing putative Zn-dependent protease [Ferruginibacter sp.]
MKYLVWVLLIIGSSVTAQDTSLQVIQKTALVPGNRYEDAVLLKTEKHFYPIELDKNASYEFYIMQKGIDVDVKLIDPQGKELVDKDSPNGNNGAENFDLVAPGQGKHVLQIIPLNEAGAPASGKYSVYVKKLTREQVEKKALIQKELVEENKKNVQTADIDHFWDAFDHLKECKTHNDSVDCFQERYINKATDGFKDFLLARNFTAEEYTTKVAGFPKFYNSIRKNTYEVKKAVPLIEEVFINFKKLYPAFKPCKVCFAIGTVRTGGTTSKDFVLIGTEITTATKDVDLSEFNGNAMSKVMAGGTTDIVQKIKNIIAHESVHTQQGHKPDSDAEKCTLLYSCFSEGCCDFIGELLAGNQINKVAQEYGDKHEAELWAAFKKQLCDGKVEDWMYNFSTAKDKPADLGYYIGYKISQAYYNSQPDKQQAIVDIIEARNVKKMLALSGYDPK